MAEYISRDLALSHPFANGKYDREHAPEDFILGFESYKEWLEDLPYIDMNKWSGVLPVGANRWIPVGERLPEKCALVILTLNCLGHRWLDAAIYVEDGIFESVVKWGTKYTPDGEDKPVAWVPIPEPYREEDET